MYFITAGLFLVQGEEELFSRSDVRITGGLLVLTSVKHSDLGVYKCQALYHDKKMLRRLMLLSGELYLSISCE